MAPKFEAVWRAFRDGLAPYGDIARWTTPNGGYFISLYTLERVRKAHCAALQEAGVVLTGAGAAFPYGRDDEQDSNIRIAPTYPTLPELRLACELLCIAVRLASVEKLLWGLTSRRSETNFGGIPMKTKGKALASSLSLQFSSFLFAYSAFFRH